jgi:hypothetical protein
MEEDGREEESGILSSSRLLSQRRSSIKNLVWFFWSNHEKNSLWKDKYSFLIKNRNKMIFLKPWGSRRLWASSFSLERVPIYFRTCWFLALIIPYRIWNIESLCCRSSKESEILSKAVEAVAEAGWQWKNHPTRSTLSDALTEMISRYTYLGVIITRRVDITHFKSFLQCLVTS